uniref:Cytochrome P450 n=1 Tax=Salvator merianae TaxID=96440 RepID=A0A8D0EEE3_SALMN
MCTTFLVISTLVFLLRRHFFNKVQPGPLEVSGAPSGPIILNEFQLIQSEEVDKLFAGVRPSTFLLYP